MRSNFFVKARSGERGEVIYTDTSGIEFIFSGGSRSWRNNNPGNLRPGKISRDNGAIGEAGKFAVFSGYAEGKLALINCLKKLYWNMNISEMIRKYAPSCENDCYSYENFLKDETGVGIQGKKDKKIRDFNEEEFFLLVKGIEKMEGWKVGRITERKISGINNGNKKQG